MTKRQVECPNYSTTEGNCKCGCGMTMTGEIVLALQAFVRSLERMLGAQVRHLITSGARCKARNDATPGAAKDSRHTHGDAVDGYFEHSDDNGKHWHRMDSRDVALVAVKTGLFGGVGWMRYSRSSGIVHLDTRPGKTVTW